MNDSYLLWVHCPEPECWTLGPQSYTFNCFDLEMMLMTNKDIKVIGGICHHTWVLTEAMKDRLRRILLGL